MCNVTAQSIISKLIEFEFDLKITFLKKIILKNNYFKSKKIP